MNLDCTTLFEFCTSGELSFGLRMNFGLRVNFGPKVNFGLRLYFGLRVNFGPRMKAEGGEFWTVVEF